MIGNIITLLVLIALVVLFGWLAKRAWGSKHKILKWPALVLAGLVMLLLALVTIVGAKGMAQIYLPYPAAPVQITVAGASAQVARGEHIASLLCASCHTQNGELPLSGGNNLAADSGLPLGEIYPPNITPGGKIKDLTDNDIWRILRTGIEPGGRLTFMSFVNTRNLSDDDALAVIAYLRTAPVVQEQRPPVAMSFLATAMVGGGLITLNVPSAIKSVTAPEKAVTKEYGEYIVSFMDCHVCHGPTLSGDAPPPSPPGAANLTVVVPQWTKDDFFTAIRTGVDKTGHQIQPPMPWKTIRGLDDVELGAVYEYLHGLTPILKKQ